MQEDKSRAIVSSEIGREIASVSRAIGKVGWMQDGSNEQHDVVLDRVGGTEPGDVLASVVPNDVEALFRYSKSLGSRQTQVNPRYKCACEVRDPPDGAVRNRTQLCGLHMFVRH
jgi:hypothetical protein